MPGLLPSIGSAASVALVTDVSALVADVSVLVADVSALVVDVSALVVDVSALVADVSALVADAAASAVLEVGLADSANAFIETQETAAMTTAVAKADLIFIRIPPCHAFSSASRNSPT